jgi:hypothetical protein
VSSSTGESAERIRGARFEADMLVLDLADGRAISVPVTWYPRLANATEPQRRNWRLVGEGYGIHWPEVDEDLSLEGILGGQAAPASSENFRPKPPAGTRGVKDFLSRQFKIEDLVARVAIAVFAENARVVDEKLFLEGIYSTISVPTFPSRLQMKLVTRFLTEEWPYKALLDDLAIRVTDSEGTELAHARPDIMTIASSSERGNQMDQMLFIECKFTKESVYAFDILVGNAIAERVSLHVRKAP